MGLCILLAVASPDYGAAFIIFIQLLAVAFPVVLFRNAYLMNRQKKQHQQEKENMRLEMENKRLHGEIQAAAEASKRIGAKLHGDVGQRLTSLSMSLYLLKEDPAEYRPEVMEHVCKDIDDIRWEIREFSHSLSGYYLESFGLLKTIEKDLERVAKTQKFHIRLEAETGYQPKLSFQKAEELHHIFVEALHNVQKYSAARELVIRIYSDDGYAYLCVHDDGKGFRPADRQGSGIKTMHRWAAAAGGDIRIESQIGKGTQLTIKIPEDE